MNPRIAGAERLKAIVGPLRRAAKPFLRRRGETPPSVSVMKTADNMEMKHRISATEYQIPLRGAYA